MRTLLTILLPLFLGVLLLLETPVGEAKTIARPPTPVAPGATMPIIENVGQFRAGARFQSQSEIGTMFLADDALWFTVLEPLSADMVEAIESHETELPPRGGVNLRVSFVGANPNPQIEPFMPLTTSVNYLQGNDPAKWHTHVPVWGGVRYRDLYPGIDLELTASADQPVRRLVVTDPQRADLATIAIQIEGADDIIAVDERVLLETAFGSVPLPLFEVEASIHGAPYTPQVIGMLIQAPFQRTAFRFIGSPIDSLLPSNLHYSTLLGGGEADYAYAVAVDSYGSIYTGGLTESFDFPTTPGAFDPDVGTPLWVRDAYLTKFNPAGTMLEYSTYLQGDDTDEVYGIVLDSSGATYLTGQTRSTNFPTTSNSPQPYFGGIVDAFLLKLSPDGSTLEYGTYLGGNNVDLGRDLALGVDGTVTVVGQTNSENFPTTPNAYDTELGALEDEFDIFVTKVAPNGTSLIYSTYIGGTRTEDGWGVAVDATGAAYVAGRTGSQSSYPTTPGVFDPIPDFAAFVVTKLAPDGTHLLYSTGVGTDADNDVGKIVLNDQNEVYVLVTVRGDDFPVTPGAYDTECGTAGVGCDSTYNDGVLFKLNATASELLFATYLVGNGREEGIDLTLDEDGNIYTIGRMESSDVLPSAGAYTSTTVGCGLWKLSLDASTLLHFATPPSKGCEAIVSPAPNMVVFSGYVYSNTYETTLGAYDTTNNGIGDAVAGRLLITLEATTATIPTTGGTLLSHPDRTTYTFTANTFTESVTLTHAPRHPLSLPPVAPLVTVGSPFVNYAIGSDGATALQPTQPYTLDIYYDASRPGQEVGLGLYYWDGSAWIPEPSAIVDPATHHIVATPTQLGWWAVLRQPNQIYLPTIHK